ncbi:unnamed protein product, partial [Ectocarpus sp. 12 AP-2014]
PSCDVLAQTVCVGQGDVTFDAAASVCRRGVSPKMTAILSWKIEAERKDSACSVILDGKKASIHAGCTYGARAFAHTRTPFESLEPSESTDSMVNSGRAHAAC